MIAIGVLKDAQRQLRERGRRKRIQCFFVEQNPTSYEQLERAVAQHHDPTNDFLIHTRRARFEDSIDEIMAMIGHSFALTFIDPTGWTGYPFESIEPLLRHEPGEVLLNYMKSFIDRFTGWESPTNTASFEGILGAGSGIQTRPKSPPA